MPDIYRDRDAILMCPACGPIEGPRQEWNDTPRAQFCPDCGLKLQPLVCAHCGTPLRLHTNFFGGHGSVAPFCPGCGEPVRLREPKMREKKPRVGRSREDYERALLARKYHSLLSPFLIDAAAAQEQGMAELADAEAEEEAEEDETEP